MIYILQGKSSLREGNIDTVLKSLFFHAEDRNCSDDVIPGTLGLDESRTTVSHIANTNENNESAEFILLTFFLVVFVFFSRCKIIA